MNGEKNSLEQTLLLVKPNVIKKNKIGAVLAAIEEKGIVIKKLRMLTMTGELAETFYAVHYGKPFYDKLIKFMTSGAIVAVVLEHNNCVDYVRKIIGNTDPEKAEEGTIRKLYADSLTENAVHASDSVENARKEIAIMFGEEC